jgi:hypothetical protein
MGKITFLGLFIGAVSAYGQYWGSPPIHVPEPSAIPELILCVTGLGLFAWRKHSRTR